MKLVIATPLYPPEIGGPATYAKLLEEGLPQHDIDVVLVKFSDVRRLPKIVRHIAYMRRVYRALKQADAVLALDPVSVGLPAMRAARRAKKPCIVKIVGDYAWEQGSQRYGVSQTLDEFVRTRQRSMAVRMLQKVQKRVANRAVSVIVPSEYLRGVVEAWGIPGKKISVIYNAVPAAAPSAPPKSVRALPHPLVVTAGRLVPWKHIDGVVDAVSALRARGIAASLAIIGDGPQRAVLETHALGTLGAGFVFVGTDHEDAMATIAAADAFVLNSSYEGLSHFLIEALGLGAPIIATQVGGNPEVIEDGVSGLLIPPTAVPALVSALDRLLSDGQLRGTLSAGARRSAERFSLEHMLESTAAHVRACI